MEKKRNFARNGKCMLNLNCGVCLKPHSAHSNQTRRRVVERFESGPARHRYKKQFYRTGVERPSSLTDWFPARPELVPGELLRFSAGIYLARNGVLRGTPGGNQE